jgi:hypothetical protein
MKKLPFPLVPFLLLASLSCCTSSPSMLANPQTGETASCEIIAMSQAIADEVAGVCERNYEAVGWIAVSGPVVATLPRAGL